MLFEKVEKRRIITFYFKTSTVDVGKRVGQPQQHWSKQQWCDRVIFVESESQALLRSINYSSAQTTALKMLIKLIPWNAGSGASSPCSFARNAMFSSLFAVLELSGRCATLLSWSNSDNCSEGNESDCQSISLACVKLSCLLYLLRHLCGCQA